MVRVSLGLGSELGLGLGYGCKYVGLWLELTLPKILTLTLNPNPQNGIVFKGSFRVKSPNFQEIPHDPSQMFPKKLLKIPQCVLITQTKF